MRKSTPLWILAFVDVFVSFLVVSYSVVQVVVDEVGNSEGISIDCGVTYPTWDKNMFYYEADDENVVESGQIHIVSSEYTLDSEDEEQVWQQLNTLRSFPQGKRNCYSLQPKQGRNNNYLVRAYYYYGNYDNKSYVPQFEFHLGVNLWTKTDLEANDDYERFEVTNVSPTDNIDVCLINTGHGIPFISLLELWPLKNSIYRTHSNSLPLGLLTRSSWGTKANYSFVRYTDDIYGRSWFLDRTVENSEPMSTSVAVKGDVTDYQLPTEVLSTAIRPRNGSSSLGIYNIHNTNNEDYNYEYYIYLHFFDFEERSDQDQQRKMKITFTDTIQDSITLPCQVLQTMVKTIPKGQFPNITITSTPDSGLPPMINALEIYRVLPQPNSTTHEGDADAMRIVKHAYKINRNWQGDPCMPSIYRWEGLTCNYLDSIPRITSLNLSSSKLTGKINSSFSDLILLESLDLSNNQLMGEIPEVLAKLNNLKLLNLSRNNLTGSIPMALREKKGTPLILSLDGNPGLCQTGSCKTITKKFIKPLVASVASVLVLAIIVTIYWILCKKKRKHPSDMKALKKYDQLKSKNHEFSQTEVHGITNDFATEIGGGGFGKVYLGRLKDGTQVAVKLLSQSSQQGLNEFQSEAKLLSLIHHRNLVSLVGYCDDGDMKALIYEYMAKGNLQYLLSDKNPNILKWKERLQIALDTACGLDYLHNGCKPPIIHRDIKSSNILLSESMQAKIADLGLSKAFANDTDTHISTRPAGTYGYLDPEFHRSGNLNKKSDVYSFGIILLELITGQRAITETSDEGKRPIADWVNPKLEIGDIQAIADPRLEGKFSSASAWKFLEIAMSCITPTSIQRADISSFVIDLRQCLAMETSLHESGESTALETSYPLSGSYSPPSAR